MKIKPTEKELRFLDWEIGMFFHFGIRSAYPGHHDWDNRPMPPEGFNPRQLDCRQWMRVARSLGATYTILTTKHHDGFALWPSAYSDYSVANTPYRDGQGDIVREYVDACREYGMKVGLYYSPAQWGGSVALDDSEYDDYFINQISELLGNYGKIDYLWFDGCGSEKHEYDRRRIIDTIRGLQPDILIFSMWDPNTRWVGNEDGIADSPNPSTVSAAAFSMNTEEDRALDAWRFLPAECDMKLRSTWFWDDNADTIKSVEQLMGIYEYSVGRGANLLLNVGPDASGRIDPRDLSRVEEFGREIRRVYGEPYASFGKIVMQDDRHYFIQSPDYQKKWGERPSETLLVRHVVLREDLRQGEGVRHFRLYAHLEEYKNKRVCIFEGDTIGHKRICPVAPIVTSRIDLEITEAEGECHVISLEAFA